ncbi:hypothetical protein TNCV_4853891 [Trichonephila clavipes]|nr:hypothetical protein TNCV_4853891 [Trichonephila clavipes]
MVPLKVLLVDGLKRFTVLMLMGCGRLENEVKAQDTSYVNEEILDTETKNKKLTVITPSHHNEHLWTQSENNLGRFQGRLSHGSSEGFRFRFEKEE